MARNIGVDKSLNARDSIADMTATSPKLKSIEKMEFQRIVSRSWLDEGAEDAMALDEFSDALKEALSDVSDKESLSQEEMEKKVQLIIA